MTIAASYIRHFTRAQAAKVRGAIDAYVLLLWDCNRQYLPVKDADPACFATRAHNHAYRTCNLYAQRLINTRERITDVVTLTSAELTDLQLIVCGHPLLGWPGLGDCVLAQKLQLTDAEMGVAPTEVYGAAIRA